MKTLGFPDRHHLNSALGWLELGNPSEAKADIDRVSLLGRTHQETFLVRWRIAARTGTWPEAQRLATVFTKVRGADPIGWICLSYSLYRLQRPLEAWMTLLPKANDFPKTSAIPYVLACYAWTLRNEPLARRFLARSAALGGPSEIRGAALEPEDVDSLTEPPSAPSTEPPLSPPPVDAFRFNLSSCRPQALQ